MTSDPRPALNKLIASFERHLEASMSRRGEDDPTVIAAYEDLADAFEAYDDTLAEATGEMTPLIVVDDQLAEELGVGDDTPRRSYSGLDDEEYDTDRSS